MQSAGYLPIDCKVTKKILDPDTQKVKKGYLSIYINIPYCRIRCLQKAPFPADGCLPVYAYFQRSILQ